MNAHLGGCLNGTSYISLQKNLTKTQLLWLSIWVFLQLSFSHEIVTVYATCIYWFWRKKYIVSFFEDFKRSFFFKVLFEKGQKKNSLVIRNTSVFLRPTRCLTVWHLHYNYFSHWPWTLCMEKIERISNLLCGLLHHFLTLAKIFTECLLCTKHWEYKSRLRESYSVESLKRMLKNNCKKDFEKTAFWEHVPDTLFFPIPFPELSQPQRSK